MTKDNRGSGGNRDDVDVITISSDEEIDWGELKSAQPLAHVHTVEKERPEESERDDQQQHQQQSTTTTTPTVVRMPAVSFLDDMEGGSRMVSQGIPVSQQPSSQRGHHYQSRGGSQIYGGGVACFSYLMSSVSGSRPGGRGGYQMHSGGQKRPNPMSLSAGEASRYRANRPAQHWTTDGYLTEGTPSGSGGYHQTHSRGSQQPIPMTMVSTGIPSELVWLGGFVFNYLLVPTLSEPIHLEGAGRYRMQLGVGGSFEGGTPTMGQKKNFSSSQMLSSNRKRKCLWVL